MKKFFCLVRCAPSISKQFCVRKENKGVFTQHNETGLMRIQIGLIHFGRVHTESGLSETV